MKQYWKSIEELVPEEEVVQEKKSSFLLSDGNDSSKNSRRDFLKYFGFGIASAAVLAGCERPVKKAIPLLIQPEEVKPGTANYYASTFYDGSEMVPILVKVRDGRPIKIEGNDLCKLTGGAASARIQASLLNLYDESRPAQPMIDGKPASWEQVDADMIKILEEWDANNEFVILTPTLISPSTQKLINDFKDKFPFVVHETFDAYSYSALRKAFELNYGKAIIPSYRLDEAKLVVGFNADFLGTWLQPVVFGRQYAEARKLTGGKREMMRHVQFESTMTLTGSNADERVPMPALDEAHYVAALFSVLAKKAGVNVPSIKAPVQIEKIAEELWQAKGKSLVLSGSNNVDVQSLICGINHILENEGQTLRLDTPINLFQGDDTKLDALLNRIELGKVRALMMWGANPLYHAPLSGRMQAAFDKVELKIAAQSQQTESTVDCKYVLPTPHFLESWDDAELTPGLFTLTQPAIRPIFKTRHAQESIMAWAGMEGKFYDYIKLNWKENIYNINLAKGKQFETFWKTSLRDGLVFDEERMQTAPAFSGVDTNIASQYNSTKSGNDLELVLYQNVPIGDGTLANNPWLQELPDPVSRVCWDNYVAVSPAFAALRGWSQGDVVTVSGIDLPVLIQPGQARNTLAVALGYGRKNAGRVATDLGKDVYPLVEMKDGYRQYLVPKVEAVATGSTYELAATQSHHSMEGRALVRETTIAEYLKNPASGNEMHEKVEKLHTSLYHEHDYKGHHWGMAIDLHSCIGCNACVVACSAENNVPVVGRNEVRRSHEMHWIRLDRYYAGDSDNPEVVRQPVMCQHCDNAPCENVCPVAATNHSSEGINQMAYNRCIGTRYCNNNCPYKVRRFNWYDYTGADTIPNNRVDPAGMTLDLKRMVLNPDVTVRAKGVIEKCSMCIQRIQEKKLTAKREGRMLEDGEIKTACQQTCPANAITFGDMNDENSNISKLLKDARQYGLLEELHTLPSVVYLSKVRNKDQNKTLS
ncbi:TAT-variant-translocated molybdopterin oxidoreductase [Carboxylicivirga linearis]|uniref:TAT-variant-translocated molybdopterin oxidoreductase n=1 Tax=Carboxylicivirga linearis TaxID=1628157 RepID=A0ABS5JPX1_9BACT|nr:TAT-variant-translocated molybdopterin oxidoreductase [Carboxylicivirga linearis]MBS2096872.1 TAT-variant-translocated molybdopterin oxidoreductase [Carboxylicivirga linearis]